MQEKLKKNLDLSIEQGSDKALGGAVLWYQTRTRAFPGASLPPSLCCWSYRCCPQAPSGPQEVGACLTAAQRHHCWAQMLQGHPSSSPKEARNGLPCTSWQGISKSTATLCLFLMALCHFPHHTSSSASGQFGPPWLLKLHIRVNRTRAKFHGLKVLLWASKSLSMRFPIDHTPLAAHLRRLRRVNDFFPSQF